MEAAGPPIHTPATEPTAPAVLELGLLLLLAALAGKAARRAGLPAVIGYLSVGIVVSPFTPGYVAKRERRHWWVNKPVSFSLSISRNISYPGVIPMKVAIIGSGNVGKALAKSGVKAGHTVTITASSAQRAAEAARGTGAHAGSSNVDAIKDADLVVVAVPYDNLGEVFQGLGSAVDGKIVVDATNHVDTKDPGSVLGALSNAEEIQKRHPKVRVVKAFNYAFAVRMAEPSVGGTRLDGFVAGDDQAAKDKVIEFVGSIGFRPVDARSAGHGPRPRGHGAAADHAADSAQVAVAERLEAGRATGGLR